MGRAVFLPLVVAISIAGFPFAALADSDRWLPQVELSGKFSSERSIGEVDLLAPLFQNADTMLFVNLRSHLDSRSASEFNLGLGLRRIIANRFILGGYAFYDRSETRNGNVFEQLTLGFEAKGERWDLRANLYRPEGGEKSTGINASTTPFLTGNNIWMPGAMNERALKGFDVEAGYQALPGFGIFGGYYRFSGTGAPDVKGPRARALWSLNRSFSWDLPVEVQVTVEITDDDIRGTRGWGGIRLRLPLGGARKSHNRSTTLRARMTERVERDVDILVGLTSDPVPLLTGGQDIWFVNNTSSGGDGSFETPFAGLAAAQSAAGEKDIIFVYAGDGTSGGYDTGFVMQNGQSLIGEFMGLSWRGFSLIAPGERPLLTPTAGIEVIINLANDNTVSGIHVDGQNLLVHGIYGQESSGTFLFEKNIIENTGIISPHYSPLGYGISIHSSDKESFINLTAIDNAIGGNKRIGINVQGDGDVIMTATNNRIYDNEEGGIAVSGYSDVVMTLNNNVISGNSGWAGISASVWGEANTLTLNMNGNTVTNNSLGIYILTGEEPTKFTLAATNNTITENDRFGIWLLHFSDVFLTLENNTLSNNGFGGISLLKTGDVTLIATGNTFSGNGYDGISISGAGEVRVTAAGNAIIGNGYSGISVSGVNEVRVTAAGNTIIGNGYNGLGTAGSSGWIDLGGGQDNSSGNNCIYGNGSTDLYSNLSGAAQGNWWGPNPARISAAPGASLDASDPLSEAPAACPEQ